MQLGPVSPTLKCADLGAGSGELSVVLPKDSLCVECNKDRVREGQVAFPVGDWVTADVLSPRFLTTILGPNTPSYDVVISNPPFEHAYAFLYIALMMITDKRQCYFEDEPEVDGVARTDAVNSTLCDDGGAPPHKRLLFLLPSDFFEGAIARRRLYRILGLRVRREFKLGRWSYYRDRGPRSRGSGSNNPPGNATKRKLLPSEKISCDSLFELVPGRSKKVCDVHILFSN